MKIFLCLIQKAACIYSPSVFGAALLQQYFFLVLRGKFLKIKTLYLIAFFFFPCCVFCALVLERYFQRSMWNTFTLGYIPLVMSLLHIQRDYLLLVDSTSCSQLQ